MEGEGMTGDNKGVEEQQTTSFPEGSWTGKLIGQYQKTKEHVETYPYVWASYIVVYGGLALWTTYRWRKLRKTEDRVRALQERLRKLYEAEQSASSSKSADKAAQTADKALK